MAVSEVLQKRLTRMFDKADRKYKEENIEGRIDLLSMMYHYGQAAGTETPDTGTIHVNKVYPRVRTAMSSLFAKRPEIIVRPRRAQDDVAAENAELLLNYLTRALTLSRELREWLFWSRLGMYGVMKLGMVKWRGMKLPTFIAHDPRSVRLDVTPDRFRPDESQWQSFRYRRSLRQLRESGLYEEKDLDKLFDKIAMEEESEFDDETTDVTIWENYIWDGKKILTATAAHGYAQTGFDAGDRIWIREKDFTDVAGLPGAFLYFVSSPKTWYPVSPVEMWMDQQREVNVFRTQKIIAAERSNAKVLYDMGRFTDEEKAKLTSPEFRAYVGVNGNPKDAMMPEPVQTVSPDVYNGEMDADNSITEIDGMGSAQLGVERPERGSTSATRDAIIENNLRMRAGDNQEIWEEALEGAYQRLLNLAQDQMDGSLMIKILGKLEANLNRNAIKGDMDVILSFGSTLPRDREREWNEAKEFYAMVGADPMFDPIRVRRYLLSKKGDIKDADQWIVQQNPMMPGMPPAGAPPALPPEALPPADPAMASNEAALDSVETGETPLGTAADFRQIAGGL